MLRLLERFVLFEGRPCFVLFDDPALFEDSRILSIPGMTELVTRLREANGKPLPDKVNCKPIGDNLHRLKITGKSARIIGIAIPEISTIIMLLPFKKEGKKSYKDINSSSGRKRILRLALDAIERHKLQAEGRKLDDVKNVSFEKNRYDVASVTPIDNFCLVISFDEDEKHKKRDDVICDMLPLINKYPHLKEESEFRTAKLDGDYIKWRSGTRISLHDVFTNGEFITREEYQELFERWRQMRGRHLLYH